MSNRYLVSFAVALGLCVLSTGSSAAARAPKTYTVTIDGTRFNPEALTVKAGDVVVWVNKDPFPHTVTSKTGGFDSQAIAPDTSWKLTPSTTGTFPYACTLHPTMTARLVVE